MEKEKEVIDMEHEAISSEMEPASNSKLKLPIIIGGIILLAVGLGTGWYFTQYSVKKNQGTILPTPSVYNVSTGNTESPTISTNKTIDLYNIGLYLPEGWTLTEKNRHPEPTPVAEGLPTKGHDCAEYEIVNIPKTLVLSVEPSCGYADGGADELTTPYVTVKEYSDGDILARTHNTENQTYTYFDTGYADISDSTGDHKALMQSGIVTIGANGERHEGESLLFLHVTAKYTGPDLAKETELGLADKVVASLMVTKYTPPSPTVTSSVKTFKNSTYEVEYPSTWLVTEDHGAEYFYDEQDGGLINIYETNDLGKFKFEDPVGKKEEIGDKIFTTKEANVRVDSIDAMRLTTEVMPGSRTDASSGIATIVPLNSKYIWINFTSTNKERLPDYEKLITTFKFVK